jgi:DNA repair protein RadA/Sms
MKKKTVFFCGNCGYSSSKWLGQCPSCSQWNTFVEEEQVERKKDDSYRKFDDTKMSSLADIEMGKNERLKTGLEEIDRVFGGGIVQGSVTLIGGEPGIGKSTLALIIAQKIAEQGKKVIYASGEESNEQIKMRASRIKINSDNLFLVIETSVEKITKIIEKEKPAVAVIDSIQTVYKEEVDSIAGSFLQVKESGAHLLYTAKKTGIPIIIIGHVTKEGMIAGPKTLEHMVDAVMYFEAEKYYHFRILRAEKNRFGSTNEIGVFEMDAGGITEIKSPSKILLDNIKDDKVGSSIVTVMEGSRPILLEIQALTSRRNFGNPQRTVTGIDYNRLLLILAIIEKKLNMHLENQDVFINVAGGIRVSETAADVGVAAAIYSSFKNKPLSTKSVYIGELGLDGEIRPVRFIEQRVQEAERLGFKQAIIPDRSKTVPGAIEIIKVKNIGDLFSSIKDTEEL